MCPSVGFLHRCHYGCEGKLSHSLSVTISRYVICIQFPYFRLPYSLDQFWLYFFRYLAFVRGCRTSHRYSDGCGTLAISGPVSMAYLIRCTAWIELIYIVQKMHRWNIAISGNRRFSWKRPASMNSSSMKICICCVAFLSQCTYSLSSQCGLNWIKDEKGCSRR